MRLWSIDGGDYSKEDIVEISKAAIASAINGANEFNVNGDYIDWYFIGNACLEVVITDDYGMEAFAGDFHLRNAKAKMDDILLDMAKQFRNTGDASCAIIADLIEEACYLVDEEARRDYGCWSLTTDEYHMASAA